MKVGAPLTLFVAVIAVNGDAAPSSIGDLVVNGLNSLASILTSGVDGDLEEPPIAERIPFAGNIEVRTYDEVNWACYTPPTDVADPSGSLMFPPLFRYISGANMEEMSIAMTRPVIIMHNASSTATTGYAMTRMCFLIGSAHQQMPPTPLPDSGITVESINVGSVITRTATERLMTSTEWAGELDGLLAEIAAVSPSIDNDLRLAGFAIPDGSNRPPSFISAGYNSPFALFNLRSEVWLSV